MFRNNFRITTLFAIIFGLIGIAFFAGVLLITFYSNTSIRPEGIVVIIGAVLFLVCSIGLLFKLNFVRYMIQGISWIIMLAWIGFVIYLLHSMDFNFDNYRNNALSAIAGVTVMVLCFCLGMIGLFGNQVVREELEGD